MENLVGDNIGFIHLIASILSLMSGTAVLLMTKGTKIHKQMGYAYVVNMAIVILTSFMIYRLFGGFGMLHVMAIISFLTLCLGVIPIWNRSRFKNWQYLHFSFMYWSVMGLYAAFVAESLTRIPDKPFFAMVGIATAGVMMVGGIAFGIKKKKWIAMFAETAVTE